MSESRKARLAALRKNRSNRDDNHEASPSNEIANNISVDDPSPNKENQVEDELLSTKIEDKYSGGKENHDSTPIDTELPEVKSDQVENLQDISDIGLESGKRENHIISYTADMKKDLKHYYHKAEIRTNRAINRIIQNKLVQD